MIKDPRLQKLKGKAQKAIGEYQIYSGQGIKGGISKAKGELNEKIADAKMKISQSKGRLAEDTEERL